MITLHESHFILILIVVSFITFVIHSYNLDCNIDCKINYYKYENYHDKKKEPVPQNVQNTMAKKTDHDINLDSIKNDIHFNTEKTYNNDIYDLPFKEEITSFSVGDRTSSHNSSIQSTTLDGERYDNEYIDKLYRGLY